jgi:hypothetical protein
MSRNIKKIIKKFLPRGIVFLSKKRHTILFLCNLIRMKLLRKIRPIDYKNIPIIINNRNHYTYLLRLITFLEKYNYKNIIILDNASTYKPLLEYYRKSKYRIIYLSENLGYKAINKCSLWNEISNDYFVYTDPDILPIEECPENFLEYFVSIMESDLLLTKVGFSLKIDDLSDSYDKKQKVIEWESQFWQSKRKDGNYDASIDTTFALHGPGVKSSFLSYSRHCRTAYPYQARHLPWYEDSNNLPEDVVYYYQTREIGGNW